MNRIEPVSMHMATQYIPEFLSGGGEMGQRIREYDWSSTPLGPIESWPHSLRTCIRIMLTSRQPIWIGWGKELIKFYNDPYKDIVRGKHPWALGSPASLVWKEIWKEIAPSLKQVMEKNEGTYHEAQLLIMERNGYPEETYYTFSYTPIPGDTGKTEGMFCANTDDTDKIISERQLRTLTQLGKRLTDCRTTDDILSRTITTLSENPQDFPFALFRTVSGDKAILEHSTPLGDAEKYIAKEINLKAGTDISDTISKALATRSIAVFDHLISRVGHLPRGAWQVSPDKLIVIPITQPGLKELYSVLVVGLNPFRLLDEKYMGFFSLVADQIATSYADVHALETERKRAEALAEIDKAKTIFFSNISHEFRTPLTLIAAPIEDALGDENTIPANKVRLKVAQDNVNRLLKMVNSLLDFSRIEAGRMRAKFEEVDLSQLTTDLASIFRAAIEKAGMKLTVNCGKNIAGYVDVDMWEIIVLNLMSNAFKYTHHGEITVTLTREEGRLKLSVADTGVGIPENELQRVFERFHRIQNIFGRSQEGTGIGLALVQELVKLHQGSIDVKSRLDEGTTFTVTIPEGSMHLPQELLAKERGGAAVSAKADIFLSEALKWLRGSDGQDAMKGQPIEAPVKNRGIKPKILLADDNSDMQEYLKRLLNDDYEVTAVGNGKLALEMAGKIEPDLIVSDVMMPEMDGFELVRRLKDKTTTMHIPVLLLSARAGEEATIEGLQSGADDYLVKPFSAKELLSRIDSNIRIARSRSYAFRQLHNLFMQAPVPIAILRGKEHRYEMANEQYLEISGRSEVVGKTLKEVFPELVDNIVPGMLDQVLETGTPVFGNEFEVKISRLGKSETVYINFVYSPFRDMDGRIIGVIVVAIDVTGMVTAKKVLEENEARLEKDVQKRTEELSRINEALRHSNKELEQFAFVTSHDLQEPLRKIQTFAYLLRERNQQKLDEKSDGYFNKLLNAANRMKTLINELLNFSRLINAGDYLKVDLNEIRKNVESDFELTIAEKNVTIKSDDLPEIDAIPLQMNQLFTNLLGNALKFSSSERKPEIIISSRIFTPAETDRFPALAKDAKHLQITFTDNGIGFDNAYKERIFEMFQRLNERSVYEGTGIGLALCSRIVANHHGAIYADGTEGVGATFHVILPLTQSKQ